MVYETAKKYKIGLNDEQLVAYVTDYLREILKDGPKVITLIGGPASGKGMLSDKLSKALGNTAVLRTDNYVKGDRTWRREHVEDKGLDPLLKYDPDYLREQVKKIISLQDGEELGIPQYESGTGIAISKDPELRPKESEYPTIIKGKQDFILIEGDFQFLDNDVLDRVIYLDVPDEIRLENRLYRDSVERREHIDDQINEAKIRANFTSRQQSQFFPYTLPQKNTADLIISVSANRLEHPTLQTKFKYSYDVFEMD